MMTTKIQATYAKSNSTLPHNTANNHQRTTRRLRRNSGRDAWFNRGGGNQRYGGQHFDNAQFKKIISQIKFICLNQFKKIQSLVTTYL